MNKSILLLDKDNDILDLVHDIMFYGYSDVYITACTESLCKTAHNCRPDLIILDFFAANNNGAALCMAIKKDEKLKDIPLIVVASHGYIRSNVADYCDALLMRPSSGEELASKLSYLIAS